VNNENDNEEKEKEKQVKHENNEKYHNKKIKLPKDFDVSKVKRIILTDKPM
jgi:hypothetical protein